MSALPKIGIDIGSTAIKIVELVPAGKDKWKLLTAASMPAPEGGGLLGARANLSYYSAAIAKIIKEAGVRSKQVVASLPEEQVFSHVVEMPEMPDSEVEQALQWQVDQYIPIPPDQAVWSHQIIQKNVTGGGVEVMLVAAAKTTVETYRQVLEQAGLEVLALETELMAVSRSIVDKTATLMLVIDIGAKSSDIGLVSRGQLIFTRTIPTAGEAFTRSIESGLGLDKTQAEQYKSTYGFTSGQLEGKLAEVMKPVLNTLVTEIRKTVDFYVSKHQGESIKAAVITGGVALMPEIVSMLSANLGFEVIIGNPFANVGMDDLQRKSLSGSEAFYAAAAGLSMRE